MTIRLQTPLLLAVLILLPWAACEPGGSEPAAVLLPVVATADGIVRCTNDLGWEVELDAVRVAVGDLEFTIEGETHAAGPLLRRFASRAVDILLPVALAHPGHQAGGEVTGSLPGDFVADPFSETVLGTATLLAGDYHGVNLLFRRATTADGLDKEDPLVGHTALLSGTARKDGTTLSFQAILDVTDGIQMVGGPFDLVVQTDTTASLALTLYTIDPFEGDTLFDHLDFGALEGAGGGFVAIAPGQAAHNVLAKTLIRHDHWGAVVRP